MLVPIAFVLAFVAVVVVVQSLASLVFTSRDRTQTVNRRLTLLGQGMAPDEVYATLVRKPEGGRLAAVAPDFYGRLFNYCRQAGLTISPERLAAYVVGAALALWFVGLVVLNTFSGEGVLINFLVSLVGAAGLSLLGASFWLGARRTRRLKQVESQMPLALDIVIRAIRAGHPVVSAVQLAADEMGDPIGSEFGLIVDETSYGLEFREALLNFARRTGSQDAHYFAVSVGIQSETGGNLAEILQNLCTVIRNRQTLHLRVKAMASEGKMSANILTALPILIVSFIFLTQPNFYSSKFSDPIFWPTVFGILLLYAFGNFVIHRMVNFKY
jgi:tight adherence protein B